MADATPISQPALMRGSAAPRHPRYPFGLRPNPRLAFARFFFAHAPRSTPQQVDFGVRDHRSQGESDEVARPWLRPQPTGTRGASKGDESMADLNTNDREKIPSKDFGLPEKA